MPVRAPLHELPTVLKTGGIGRPHVNIFHGISARYRPAPVQFLGGLQWTLKPEGKSKI